MPKGSHCFVCLLHVPAKLFAADEHRVAPVPREIQQMGIAVAADVVFVLQKPSYHIGKLFKNLPVKKKCPRMR